MCQTDLVAPWVQEVGLGDPWYAEILRVQTIGFRDHSNHKTEADLKDPGTLMIWGCSTEGTAFLRLSCDNESVSSRSTVHSKFCYRGAPSCSRFTPGSSWLGISSVKRVGIIQLNDSDTCTHLASTACVHGRARQTFRFFSLLVATMLSIERFVMVRHSDLCCSNYRV